MQLLNVSQTGVTVTSGSSSATLTLPLPSASQNTSPIASVAYKKAVRLVSNLAAINGVYVRFHNGVGIDSSVTIGAAGSGYTSIPTIAFSGGSGTGAAGFVLVQVASVSSIGAGGSSYQVGDVLTGVGGTGTEPTFTVSTVSSGAVTAVSITTAGILSAIASSPISVTGGHGTGCTLNVTYSVQGITLTSTGKNYLTAPTIAFSGGGGTGASATATVTPIVATSNDMLIVNRPEYFNATAYLYLAYIQNNAAAELNVIPLEV